PRRSESNSSPEPAKGKQDPLRRLRSPLVGLRSAAEPAGNREEEDEPTPTTRTQAGWVTEAEMAPEPAGRRRRPEEIKLR
ncbi:MAG: hypothetical protein ACOC5B_03695, partial [Myxococcota bacterium]